MTKNKETFEEKSIKLNKIVEKLENDKDLSLDQIASLYKEGKDLVKELSDELNALKSMVSNEIVFK